MVLFPLPFGSETIGTVLGSSLSRIHRPVVTTVWPVHGVVVRMDISGSVVHPLVREAKCGQFSVGPPAIRVDGGARICMGQNDRPQSFLCPLVLKTDPQIGPSCPPVHPTKDPCPPSFTGVSTSIFQLAKHWLVNFDNFIHTSNLLIVFLIILAANIGEILVPFADSFSRRWAFFVFTITWEAGFIYYLFASMVSVGKTVHEEDETLKFQVGAGKNCVAP